MRPLIERLIVAADQESLDRSLDELVGCGSPKKFKTTLAKQLQSFGAQFSNGVLSNLSISLASCSDTQGAARVAQLRDLGWKPQDLRGEGDIMKDILQGRMLKTLDVWVGIYETYDNPLPDTEGMSCMIFLSQKQQQFKNKAETFTKMAERMLLSGLVGWQDGHFQDWKKNAPAWILETAVEGDKRRLDRQTQTPVNINPNRKYRI